MHRKTQFKSIFQSEHYQHSYQAEICKNKIDEALYGKTNHLLISSYINETIYYLRLQGKVGGRSPDTEYCAPRHHGEPLPDRLHHGVFHV